MLSMSCDWTRVTTWWCEQGRRWWRWRSTHMEQSSHLKEMKTSPKEKVHARCFYFAGWDAIECMVEFSIDSHIIKSRTLKQTRLSNGTRCWLTCICIQPSDKVSCKPKYFRKHFEKMLTRCLNVWQKQVGVSTIAQSLRRGADCTSFCLTGKVRSLVRSEYSSSALTGQFSTCAC
jgi:hypothetical protein